MFNAFVYLNETFIRIASYKLDATYKLLWLGFPVLIVGISDINKVFHPLGIAFCKDKKSNDFAFIFTSLNIGIQRCNLDELESVNLLADAADSITNGFKLAFNYSTCEYKRGMCWFHKRKCVKDKCDVGFPSSN